MAYGTQIATRLPDADVARLDDLVAQGRFESRADAVRAAVARFLDAERRRAIGEAIAEGYRRVPQTEDELAVAEANVRRLVTEEPW
jgi:Arc/MetJ-type ribon-helix-helix transcriptional regulator